ncbi:MAG: hypothetical protein HOP33_10565 [Verrucomicrobia bacterium]|nr:hypothetical protein [Verrucomicrobiota bacterium]
MSVRNKSAGGLDGLNLEGFDPRGGSLARYVQPNYQYRNASYQNRPANNRYQSHSHPQFFFLMDHPREKYFAKRVEHDVFLCDASTLGEASCRNQACCRKKLAMPSLATSDMNDILDRCVNLIIQ